VRAFDRAAVVAGLAAEEQRKEQEHAAYELRREHEKAVSDTEIASGRCDPERLRATETVFRRIADAQAGVGSRLAWERQATAKEPEVLTVPMTAAGEYRLLAVSMEGVVLVQASHSYTAPFASDDPPTPANALLELEPGGGEVAVYARGCVVYGVLIHFPTP
jgi:hypothetical protein